MRKPAVVAMWFMLCAFGLFPTGAASPIQTMCDAITGGCAEAWGLAEAPVSTYSGPLFQLYNGVSTLDIGQAASQRADMSTWSAFCGGSNTTSGGITTNSVCKVSKIYAEVHGSGNDLVPSVFAGSGPDCADLYCACPFRYEAATGLPIFYNATDACEYTLTGDQAATGISAGTNSISILYNGMPNTIAQCCGSVGMAHAYNAGDTPGTDFMLFLSFGSGVPGYCAGSTTYCFSIDEEGGGGGIFTYVPPSPGPIFAVVTHNSGTLTDTGWMNGQQIFSTLTGTPALNAGTSVHVGGGGDLSQPDMTVFREFAITNTAVSSADMAAAFTRIKANFAGLLTFGACGC